MLEFTSPNKTASVAQQGGGLYVGKITSVQNNSLFIEVPGVAPGFSFGPCRTSAAVFPQEDEQVNLVGTEVLCAFVNGGLDEVVVLARLA